MTRSKHDADLLRELGYDPDDPTYTVENFGGDEEPVTATETTEKGAVDAYELAVALQEAITALQRVLRLIT
jgi:hypothetical protein